jgi:hypothetical protein
MRFSILVSAVLALIFAPITITADKGYRRVKFPASELYPKFAEYDDENWYVSHPLDLEFHSDPN